MTEGEQTGMKSFLRSIHSLFSRTDWPLFIFLLTMLNVKMIIKLAAILIFIFLNRKNIADKSIFRQKLMWFYFSMIAIALFNFILDMSSFSVNYAVTTAAGLAFWLMCIAAAAINSCYVKKTSIQKLHATLTLFFITNIATGFFQLLLIMVDSGSLNPYRFQGMYQKYFISTGDMITGITFDVSITSALISSLGTVYFLSRNRFILVLLSMSALLLTTSNFINILTAAILLFVFIFQSSRNQKSVIIVCFAMLAFFLARVTPQNNRYMKGALNRATGTNGERMVTRKDKTPLKERPDSLLNDDERKRKTALLYIDSLNSRLLATQNREGGNAGTWLPAEKPSVPRADIHSEPYQRKRDTSGFQKELYQFGAANNPAFDSSLALAAKQKIPGKIIALKQTINYFRGHPLKVLTGAGTGNFSSKLALRATGLKIAGGYPSRFIYIHPDFKAGHLELFLVVFSRDKEFHSLLNTPNSVYDQVLAEYGLAGFACLIFLYIGFFLRRGMRKYNCGIPALLLLLGAFAAEYWFEQLSVVILFELIMLINIKETAVNDE